MEVGEGEIQFSIDDVAICLQKRVNRSNSYPDEYTH